MRTEKICTLRVWFFITPGTLILSFSATICALIYTHTLFPSLFKVQHLYLSNPRIMIWMSKIHKAIYIVLAKCLGRILYPGNTFLDEAMRLGIRKKEFKLCSGLDLGKITSRFSLLNWKMETVGHPSQKCYVSICRLNWNHSWDAGMSMQGE